MTPSSVDALRTRLARAFEVAALRDPSAELAAFEAAVRREAYEEGYTACLVGREPDEHEARVRHEHGERIAKAQESREVLGSWRDFIRGYRQATRDDAQLARDLSPAP